MINFGLSFWLSRAVEIDEPTTEKIRECGAKETQLSLILEIVVSCLTFPVNIC